MRQKAERYPAALVLVGGLVVFVLVVFIDRAAPEHAGGAGEGDERRDAQHDGGGEQVSSGKRCMQQ